jgi:hypothetical protein
MAQNEPVGIRSRIKSQKIGEAKKFLEPDILEIGLTFMFFRPDKPSEADRRPEAELEGQTQARCRTRRTAISV